MTNLIIPAGANKNPDYAREITELSDFISKPAGNYNGGMGSVVIGHIARERAKYQGHDFIDIRNIRNNKTKMQQDLSEQQATAENKVLICAPQSIEKASKNRDLKELADALELIRSQKRAYKKVLFTVGVSGYGIGHAMAMAIEGDKVFLFDQLGGNAYLEAKADITRALVAKGLRVVTNTQPLSGANKDDCASVSSHILSDAIQASSIQDLMNKCETNAPLYNDDAIKAQHLRDKAFAKTALEDINTKHRDDRNKNADVALLQKLLHKAPAASAEERKAIVKNFWDTADKADFVSKFKPQPANNNLNIDTDLEPSPANETWKEEVRIAVKKTNESGGTDFAEYEDREHPERLNFQSGSQKMIFASRNSVSVEGDLNTFRNLCQTAKNMDINLINFGKFEEHPEYRATLYLACLMEGMKTNNEPTLEELQDAPEYPKILEYVNKKRRIELKDTLRRTEIELNKANTQAKGDPEYQGLQKQIDDATKQKDWEKKAELKEQLKENKSSQDLDVATFRYKAAMKESLLFYIANGSEPAKENDDKEKREKRVKEHLKKYDVETFFFKAKDGANLFPDVKRKDRDKQYKDRQEAAKEAINPAPQKPKRGGGR